MVWYSVLCCACVYVGIVYRKRLRSDVDSGAPCEGGVEGEGEPTAKRLKKTEDPAKKQGDEVHLKAALCEG